jgi:hypothetical protein
VGAELSGGVGRGASRATNEVVVSLRPTSAIDRARIFGSHVHIIAPWKSSDSASATQMTGIVTTSCRLTDSVFQTLIRYSGQAPCMSETRDEKGMVRRGRVDECYADCYA